STLSSLVLGMTARSRLGSRATLKHEVSGWLRVQKGAELILRPSAPPGFPGQLRIVRHRQIVSLGVAAGVAAEVGAFLGGLRAVRVVGELLADQGQRPDQLQVTANANSHVRTCSATAFSRSSPIRSRSTLAMSFLA